MAEGSSGVKRMAESRLLVVLQVEGSLVADLASLLETESRAVLARNKWLGLELSGVTNIDSSGLSILKKLAQDRVHFINFLKVNPQLCWGTPSSLTIPG